MIIFRPMPSILRGLKLFGFRSFLELGLRWINLFSFSFPHFRKWLKATNNTIFSNTQKVAYIF